ncbi:DEAD/DEAH box helicase family protein [Streptomyces sp. NPDC059582]|uniref:DEAD/DEAH box helicase family protein n=1 Tax=Streptomyces sp. NPDC059582 TaxID=3346875 RepID=UPI0036744345
MKLRDHQTEAVAVIVRGLDVPSGGIPVNGLRRQVHASCGTAKTVMPAASPKRLVPRGRVPVLVPTLDLLSQTVQAWHEVGHQLAWWHGQGPVTIYAT